MEMKEIVSNSHYKVLEVSLNSGETMPLHKASSDAFIMVKEGSAKIIFSDHEVDLQQGSTQIVPAHKEHKLQIIASFKACIVMTAEAEIKFI